MLQRIDRAVRRFDRRIDILVKHRISPNSSRISSNLNEIDQMMKKPHFARIDKLCYLGVNSGIIYHLCSWPFPPLIPAYIVFIFIPYNIQYLDGKIKPFSNLVIFCCVLLILYLTRS